MSTLYITEFCRFYLLIILSMGVYGKLSSFTNFSHSVEKIFNLSQTTAKKRTAKSISAIVIFAETVIALLILFDGIFATIGMGAAALLITCFTAVIAKIVFQKRLIQCNCFGTSVHTITWLDLVRNFLIFSACGIFLAISYHQPDYSTASSSILSDSILFCLAIVLSIYTMSLKELQFLMRPTSLG